MSQLDPSSLNRRQQLVETYRMTRESDPRIGLKLLIAFVLGAAIGFAVFWVLPGGGVLGWIMAIVGALLVGLLLTMILFGRRAKTAGYARIEGQVGAAYAALTMLRRGWTVTQAVAADPRAKVLVHRVVGPPGIVLVGEGESPSKTRALLATERRKTARVLPETPLHEVVCGNGEGEVRLPDLTKHVMKLGRQVKPAELTDVLNRLKALDNTRGTLPIPKGPMPTNMKGLRQNMRGR